MAYENEIEVMAGARDDLVAILQSEDPEQIDQLNPKLKKFLERVSGTDVVVLDEGRNWKLFRAWADVTDTVLNQYGGNFAAFQYDYDNSILRFLENMFTEEWQWLRPLGVFRFSDGMQLGTQYNNEEGDVVVNNPARIPWFPFDYTKVKNWFPDLTVGEEYDEDGNLIDPGTTYNIVHDYTPYLNHPGQWRDSKGPAHLKRRTMQITSNQKLGADAFGLDPWTPNTIRTACAEPVSQDLDMDGQPDDFVLSEVLGLPPERIEHWNEVIGRGAENGKGG